MVLDKLSNASRYTHMHPLFAQAFRFLQEADITQLPVGKHDIAGDQLFAMISDGEGFSKQKARLEAHKRYIDIQYVVTGCDHMGWKDLAACEAPNVPYSEENDIAFFPDQTNSWFDVQAGSFTIFFPDDAHAPLGTEEVVRKVVLKIAVQ
ncbi:YhcH/YjgK/YiaL family protein [Rufibacter glacialis]|uniref:DUF386 domain-containing protein n=1 Tax=Rufibacter glacialis TaxID=1259555 RepID=A0A5M8QMW8_9BACT|nr:YhcH/YjgK/YiaL family protein [Rufibacter glacialis]KAA6437557.1 DUF386 domain-containing protein [Rufibacter glacialis]GGK58347.1 DUF386 domain-containing protein [Rufibacter glacialis]